MEHKKVIRYDNVLPENTIFHWDEIGHFRLDQYILMHSVLYRTEMLKLCQLKLPKHTFYVDNIYVYYPLPHVRTLYYLMSISTAILSGGKISPSTKKNHDRKDRSAIICNQDNDLHV